ncbi:MAG: hypothetical protein G3M78_15160 [Candidatus Nitrohelix vancouverensis]|uniref:Uncharacterized protein n=1 Tax=Candidatus Nitrohelix vancouverensis TaxID=2705534 RepID=A0A7T0C556_9BACT|nr:MAG: hypothetical protein G3M78_15160 [Candidatus Nitrohelix vancouverensis]
MEDDDWLDLSEQEGVTLGPEDALRREIEKTKRLKVERLQLRDQVEKLKQKVQFLENENETLRHNPAKQRDTQAPTRTAPLPAVSQWALILLGVNLLACAWLLYSLIFKEIS